MIRFAKNILILSLLLTIALNCKKETLKVAPTVTMASVTNITAVSASTGGSVSADGGVTVTDRGICWSATNNPPTTSDGIISSGSGTGIFTTQITGLIPGTTYYVTAYATNSVGTSYSSPSTFTTLATAPNITTSELSSVSTTTAVSGGTITADGGSPVTARGVCWSTNQNPTIADNKTTDGIGMGSFSSSISNLVPGAAYYFRAYATNSVGTTYGNQVTITTKEENIQFEVTPFNGTSYVDIRSEFVPFTVKVLSKIPPAGITYSVRMIQTDNSMIVFKLDTTTANNNVVLRLGKFGISNAYSISIEAKSKVNPTNFAVKTFSAKRNRIYKNYLKTSYELSNYDEWLSSDDLYENGKKYFVPELPGAFDIQQYCQLDIDGDGREDLFYYDSYPLVIPLPNPPPRVFMNNGSVLEKIEWNGPSILNPHGSKLLVGDFNNDSIPDVFSCVGFDVPNGVDGSNQISHLIFNSPSGFNKVKEFSEQPGYHHTGCSGDIDNDGDLDVVMFNFAYWNNGVSSKILWNDGKGNFSFGTSGFSEIAPIHQSELYDINNDGYLDLVCSYVANHLKATNDIIIMWGNGKDFSLSNSTSFTYPVNFYLWDIDFIDINNDGIAEILLSEDNVNINEWKSNDKFFIDLYKSDDKGKTFIKKTDQYFDVNNMYFVNKLRVKDIDNNGRMDIYTSDKKDNIRWEWNGNKFVRK